jgi:hypothetical protein
LIKYDKYSESNGYESVFVEENVLCLGMDATKIAFFLLFFVSIDGAAVTFL